MVQEQLEAEPDGRWTLAQRRLVRAGVVAAALGVVAAGGAWSSLSAFLANAAAQRWALVSLVAAAAMLAVTVVQAAAWRPVAAAAGLVRASWVAHLLSYAVTLVMLLAALSAAGAAGWGSVAAGLWAFALLLVLVAQVTGGVQYRRASGPPGTLPAHLRRFRAWVKAAQEREDAD